MMVKVFRFLEVLRGHFLNCVNPLRKREGVWGTHLSLAVDMLFTT